MKVTHWVFFSKEKQDYDYKYFCGSLPIYDLEALWP